MLPRKLRLSRRTFPDVRNGTRLSSPHFSLTYSLVTEGVGGCAVVISKKVARLSVARHLLKRRIMHIVRPRCTSVLSIVVFARPGSEKLLFSEIQNEIGTLLQKIPHP